MSTQRIHRGFIRYPEELQFLFTDFLLNPKSTRRTRTNPLKVVCFYYSLHERDLDPMALLTFLKNKAVVLDAGLKEWFVFSSFIKGKPVLLAMLWMERGLWRNNHILTHDFVFEGVRPFLTELVDTYGPWRDALVQRVPLTNLDLRGIFQRPYRDQKYRFNSVSLAIFKVLLQNFRADLRSLDYTFSFEWDEPSLKAVREIMAARVLSDNRIGRLRADVSENLQKHFKSLFQISSWKWKWSALNRRAKELDQRQRILDSRLRQFQGRERSPQGLASRQKRLAQLDEIIARRLQKAKFLKEENDRIAQANRKSKEAQAKSWGWF